MRGELTESEKIMSMESMSGLAAAMYAQNSAIANSTWPGGQGVPVFYDRATNTMRLGSDRAPYMGESVPENPPRNPFKEKSLLLLLTEQI